MGFVKSAQEIAEMIASMRYQPYMRVRSLSIEFSSDPIILRQLLPPPLVLNGSSAIVSVASTEGGCVGPYYGGRLLIACSYNQVPGYYTLAVFMDSDAPLIFGKELEGAPKKLAAVHFERSSLLVVGEVVRHGVTLMRVEASLNEDLGPAKGVDRSYSFVARFRPDGDGLRDDALLTCCETEFSLSERWAGDGAIILGWTEHDPLSQVPIGVVRRASYAEGDRFNITKEIATVPAEEFLPFAFSRMDNWAAYKSRG